VLNQDEGASKTGRVDGVEKEDVDIRKIAECQAQEAGNQLQRILPFKMDNQLVLCKYRR
jgi:hypothetical protein